CLAACIEIQRIYRGRLSRKGYTPPARQAPPRTTTLLMTKCSAHYSAQGVSIARLSFRDRDDSVKRYAAMLIMRAYGRYKQRLLSMYSTEAPFVHAARVIIQSLQANRSQHLYSRWQSRRVEESASRITRAFVSYVHRKEYRRLRDMVAFRRQGDPVQLLKHLAPREAELCETNLSMQTVVRLRLGGESWPPRIYFKVFVRGGVVDLGDTAPRDYHSEMTSGPWGGGGLTRTMGGWLNEEEGMDRTTWYSRVEANPWRPVGAAFASRDEVVMATTATTLKVDWRSLTRRQDKEKQRRQKKIRWMQQLYRMKREGAEGGREGVDEGLRLERDTSDDASPGVPSQVNSRVTEEERDADPMDWSQGLDFDSYMRDWLSVGTTLGSGEGGVTGLSLDGYLDDLPDEI
ncbi:hypothetical protein KIPB_006207, partial [Kipferlia bialata]